MPHAPSRIAVVLNGNAKSVTDDVVAALRQILKHDDLFVSKKVEEAAQIADALIDKGYGTVLTGGGDGTFTVMVTELVRAARERNVQPPRLGLLKLGTGNALAWVVGAGEIVREELLADLARLEQGDGYKEIRLVEIEGKLSPFAGVGADAQVLADYNLTKEWLAKTPLKPISAGLFSYAVSAVTRTLPGYLRNVMPHVRVINSGRTAYQVGPGAQVLRSFERDEVLYDGPARICALATIPFYGFGLRMFPFATARPDRMHLRVATIGSFQFVTQLKPIWEGTFADPSALSDFLVESVTVHCEPSTDLQIGGDPQGKRTCLQARISDEPIRLVDYYSRASAAE